jgi:outer membrane protein OmpA-like peptidoglycan-associated protein
VGASAQLQPASLGLLNGVADLLEAHGDIARVRIEAHWDSSTPKPQAVELTQQQAEAVRTYLIGRGIAGARLTAVGVGTGRPLVPNLTPLNRARNRRIELHLE